VQHDADELIAIVYDGTYEIYNVGHILIRSSYRCRLIVKELRLVYEAQRCNLK
jgi:hypothetical protein